MHDVTFKYDKFPLRLTLRFAIDQRKKKKHSPEKSQKLKRRQNLPPSVKWQTSPVNLLSISILSIPNENYELVTLVNFCSNLRSDRRLPSQSLT